MLPPETEDQGGVWLLRPASARARAGPPRGRGAFFLLFLRRHLCVLFVYLCYVGKLYIEALLQFFYVAMAIVGWFYWKDSSSDSLIKKWTTNLHVRNILISSFLAFIIGFLFDN